MKLRRTPLVECAVLGEKLGAPVFLKLESLQVTGSFKARGAYRALAALSAAERKRGVVAASAGNHGAGLAWAGARLGVAVTVAVPKGTPANKRARIASFGAELIVEGQGYDAAEAFARQLAAKSGRVFISAFEHPDVIAGNGGDLGRELLQQNPSLRRVVVPVGGGGLIAGLTEVLAPAGIVVLGVQPEQNCAMHDSLRLGRALTDYHGGETLAEGCEGAVGASTYEIVARHGGEVVLASEQGIAEAVAFLYGRCGVVAEASAAVPVAALLEGALSRCDGQTAVVISGGNIDDEVLNGFLEGS